MVDRHYIVSGQVQGVSFRAFVLRQASALGIHGLARNLRDGRVEIVASGDEAALIALDSLVARGPSEARVSSVERVAPHTVLPKDLAQFMIVADGEQPW